MQPNFFPSGDDLPLFSGAPVRIEERPFNPQPAAEQPALLDLRPQFGVVEPQYQPSQEAQEDTEQ